LQLEAYNHWSASYKLQAVAGQRNTSLIVIPRDEALVVIVRRIARIHAIRSMDQLQVVELPVIRVLDVKNAAVAVREGSVEGCGRAISLARTSTDVRGPTRAKLLRQ
jgi:hypothetical protein